MSFVTNIARYLTPYNAPCHKYRLGQNKDGGYVVPLELILSADTLYSYGVGDNVDFEWHLFNIHPKIRIFLFDPYITTFPCRWEGCTFLSEGIGPKKEDKFDTLNNHITRFGGSRLLVKMDVEGAEWTSLAEANLEQVICLVLELHQLGNSSEQEQLLARLAEEFFVYHVHANNYLGTEIINGFIKGRGDDQNQMQIDAMVEGSIVIPTCLEVTYINRQYCPSENMLASPLPSTYDYPCCPDLPDIPLNFWL